MKAQDEDFLMDADAGLVTMAGEKKVIKPLECPSDLMSVMLANLLKGKPFYVEGKKTDGVMKFNLVEFDVPDTDVPEYIKDIIKSLVLSGVPKEDLLNTGVLPDEAEANLKAFVDTL